LSAPPGVFSYDRIAAPVNYNPSDVPAPSLAARSAAGVDGPLMATERQRELRRRRKRRQERVKVRRREQAKEKHRQRAAKKT